LKTTKESSKDKKKTVISLKSDEAALIVNSNSTASLVLPKHQDNDTVEDYVLTLVAICALMQEGNSDFVNIIQEKVDAIGQTIEQLYH